MILVGRFYGKKMCMPQDLMTCYPSEKMTADLQQCVTEIGFCTYLIQEPTEIPCIYAADVRWAGAGKDKGRIKKILMISLFGRTVIYYIFVFSDIFFFQFSLW